MKFPIEVNELEHYTLPFRYDDILVLYNGLTCKCITSDYINYKGFIVSLRVIYHNVKCIYRNGILFAYKKEKTSHFIYHDKYCKIYLSKKDERKADKMAKRDISDMLFRNTYDALVNKVLSKGQAVDDLNHIFTWLTGYSQEQLDQAIDSDITMKDFYTCTPEFNPRARFITGSICGYKVQEITDEFTWKFRCVDKLVDELCKGKSIDKITDKLNMASKL